MDKFGQLSSTEIATKNDMNAKYSVNLNVMLKIEHLNKNNFL